MIPAFTLPDLPVADCLPALLASLEARPNAVLVAPPGAGKTTTVPLALLSAAWRGGGGIVMLEPRRLAARAAATRMASLIGEAPGQTVGYRTRLDSAVSAATRIEVVTEGLLVRRLLGDPGLSGTAMVIFDEVHERGLDADLALAFCLDLQREYRPELRLLAMSATADGARLSTLLDAPVIESAGRMFPVEVRHAARDLASARDLPDAVARACRTALAEHDGDILAFLPGMGEIRRAQAALQGAPALVLPLHGDLPPAEQDRALRPAEGQRRVVLATSIAETSLTVPGVRVVVDGGFRRAPRMDASTGLSRLDTMRVSRAAADQRAGRAGREAPGVAIRLWSPALHRGLAPFDRPAILEAELAGLALDCAAWGADPAALPFPDAPPTGALAAGRALLTVLGALDAEGRISELGRRMATAGRASAAGGHDAGRRVTGSEGALACDLAALLEERDPLRDAGADIHTRLAALHGHPGHADRGASARIKQAAQRYRSPAGRARCRGGPRGRCRCRPFAGGGVSRPHRPAPGRAGIVPAFRRRRRTAAADRPACARRRACWSWRCWSRRPRPASLMAAPLDVEALPDSVIADAMHRAGRKRLRPGHRRGVQPPPPPLRRAGAAGPDGAGRPGGHRGHAGARADGKAGAAAVDRGGTAIPEPAPCCCAASTGIFRTCPMRRLGQSEGAWLAPHLAGHDQARGRREARPAGGAARLAETGSRPRGWTGNLPTHIALPGRPGGGGL